MPAKGAGRCGAISVPLIVAGCTAVVILVVTLFAGWRRPTTTGNALLRVKLDYELESVIETGFNQLKERPRDRWTDLAEVEYRAPSSIVGLTLGLTAVPMGSDAVRLRATASGNDVDRMLEALATFETSPEELDDPSGTVMGRWELTVLPNPS